MITIFSKPGTLPKKHGSENQDAVLKTENSRFIILCLADGVSACKNGHRGAQIACEAVAGLFCGNEESFYFSKSKTAFLVIEEIVYNIRKESERFRQSPESYASTLLFCCIDKQRQKALLLNLGDGAAYTVSGGRCSLLLSPVSITENLCPQTLTKNAFQTALVRKFIPENQTGLFMCTDGLIHEMNQKEYGAEIKNLIRMNAYRELEILMHQIQARDDVSFIAYMA